MSFQAMTWAVEQNLPDAQSKLLLLILANHAGNHEDAPNTCWPSIRLLAQECSMSEDTVIRRLAVLRTLKLVKITGRCAPDGRQTSNLYSLPVPGRLYKKTPAYSMGEGSCQQPTPPAGSDPHPPLAAVQTSNMNQSIEPPKTGSGEVWRITKIIEAKRAIMNDLAVRYRRQVATGFHWNDEEARLKFVQIKREIQALNEKMASM